MPDRGEPLMAELSHEDGQVACDGALRLLRVVRLDGRPLTVASAAARNVLLPVDTFALCLVGFLVMLLSRRRQRIGDLVAGTVVTSADDHPHLAAHERARSAMIVGYPLAWVATALVAISLPSHPVSARAAYTRQVVGLCHAAWASVGDATGVEGMRRAGVAAGELERALEMVTPPPELRDAHLQLVAAESHMSAQLLEAAGAARTSASPRAVAEESYAAFERGHAVDVAGLEGLGLDACL